jgi:hypothetical protein
VTGTVLLDLTCLLLSLELLLLLHLLLQHLLETLVVLGLAEHPRPLLGPNVPPQVLLLLLLAESDAVRYQFQLLLELTPALPQLAQPDGLELLGQEELTVQRVRTQVEGRTHRVRHAIIIFIKWKRKSSSLWEMQREGMVREYYKFFEIFVVKIMLGFLNKSNLINK